MTQFYQIVLRYANVATQPYMSDAGSKGTPLSPAVNDRVCAAGTVIRQGPKRVLLGAWLGFRVERAKVYAVCALRARPQARRASDAHPVSCVWYPASPKL